MRGSTGLVLTLSLLCVGCGGSGGDVGGPAGPPKGSGFFTAPAFLTMGIEVSPRQPLLGQFFGPANLDLAVATIFGGVQLRAGDGTGAFTTPPTSVLGAPFLREGFVADFDHDGQDDLAVTSDSGGVVVWLRDAMGGFTPPTGMPYGTGASPFSIAAAHLNADAEWDLVTGNSGDGTVTVLLGAANGTFTSTGPYAAAATIRGTAAGDLDWDGFEDVVGSTAAGTYLLTGNGNGTLDAPVQVVPAPGQMGGVATGDLNGDAHPDLVVADRGAALVQVRLSTGGGGFAAPAVASVATASEPHDVHLADLDGDGKLDLLVSCMTGQQVNLFRGLGDGTFAPWPSLPVPGYAMGIATGDLNGDSVPDLAVTVDDPAAGQPDFTAIFLAIPQP